MNDLPIERRRGELVLTRDAADLYAGLGFSVGPGSLIYMERCP